MQPTIAEDSGIGIECKSVWSLPDIIEKKRFAIKILQKSKPKGKI